MSLGSAYTLERELGRGGMATVYLARDLKHRRDVVVKVLRPELAAAVGAERFLREIRLTAALQHPHILPLYDSGEAGGLLYYVAPYVAGGSLRDRLARERQLPVDEVIAVVRALAAALDYAHRHGIVHRDVKPENVLVQDGQPLLADFGISLALDTSKDGSGRLTATGLAIGTPQYMSPEQAAGDRAVGPQSDVYALGAVAYELLAGEPPITGPTPEAVLARVLVERPRAIRTVRDTVPAAVETAILKALAKAPADRFRTAGEFAAALTAPAPVQVTAVAHAPRAPVARVAAGATSLVALGMAVFVLMEAVGAPADRLPAIRRQITFSGSTLQAAISPDGQFIAYVTEADSAHAVIVQDLAGGATNTVYKGGDIRTLEWSPDGTRLLLGSWRRALVLPRSGGAAYSVDAATRYRAFVYAYWLPDGSRVSLHDEPSTRLQLVDLRTEDTVAVPLERGGLLYTYGSWSPDGRLFAVAAFTQDPLRYAIRVVSLDGRTEDIAVDSVPLESPRWSLNGQAVYYLRTAPRSSVLRRIRVSPRTGRVRGPAEQLQRELEALPQYAVNFATFSVTRDRRRLVYTRGTRFSNLWLVKARGPASPPHTATLTTGTAMRWSPKPSPDGRWLAFAQETHDGAELFRMPIVGGAAAQITVGARVWPQGEIAWSPDGERIAFQSVRAGRTRVWVADVDDGRLRRFDRSHISTDAQLAWAPGRWIAYRDANLRHINLLDPDSGTERPLLTGSTPEYPFSPQYSPDGRRLALWSNRGPNETGIWVFDFRDSSYTKVGPDPWWPRGWSADGRFIYGGGPVLYRFDTRRQRPPEPILTVPLRRGACTPAGPRRPEAFVCAAFDYVSDIWMIENFDQGAP